MSLLSGLIELTNIEDKQGRWRITLEYDNSGDRALVKTGDGEVVGECHELFDEDSEAMVQKQFERAIQQACSWYSKEQGERRLRERLIASNQCVHPGGITDNDGIPRCPFTWRPIETAPKDGSYILIWLGSPWGKIVTAKWHAPWSTWLKEVPGLVDGDRFGIGNEESSYWMPLPEPPEKK